MIGPILALAGGVGGAKLALGLSKVLPPDELAIVVNTGDDEVFHGLHVSPDLDTMMYALAGLTNPETGWGVAEESFNALGMLGRYSAPTWFNLGDKDLATHIRRTELLRRGWSLSEVTADLCHHLGVTHNIVSMSDQRVRTIVETDEGDLSFQDYFVRRQCLPVASGIRFEDAAGHVLSGAEGAESTGPVEVAASPGFVTALETAASIVFCPSNPFLSIAPILAVAGVRKRIASFSGPRVAISPIVGGQALRGPAAKLLAELGHDVSCLGVARWYRGLCDIFIIDEADSTYADTIAELGMRVEVANTVMVTDEEKVRLANRLCDLLDC